LAASLIALVAASTAWKHYEAKQNDAALEVIESESKERLSRFEFTPAEKIWVGQTIRECKANQSVVEQEIVARLRLKEYANLRFLEYVCHSASAKERDLPVGEAFVERNKQSLSALPKAK
jgi:hypothetical protein